MGIFSFVRRAAHKAKSEISSAGSKVLGVIKKKTAPIRMSASNVLGILPNLTGGLKKLSSGLGSAVGNVGGTLKNVTGLGKYVVPVAAVGALGGVLFVGYKALNTYLRV